ncbi:MAG: MBL fold metallo-hydrolase [Thermodesulfovibrionales bacterium]|nr:MBL fold metallo-hydrolase [Thermodesulfovibrionales bacterium]
MKKLFIWLFLFICLEMSVSGETRNPIITVIYDNNPYKEGLEAGWGFSCVIKGVEKTILFDTGGDGQRLLANMKKSGIDPKQIDVIVLSHIHGDHVGGLQSVLRKNPKAIVYLPISFPNSFKDEVKGYEAKVIEVQRPLKICENVHSTGELGTGIKEQSLIVRTDKGLIVITGCAHPGVIEILNKVRDLMKDDFLLLMGGYHLGGKGIGELEKIVSSFKKLGVCYVGPCHCTGDGAKELFKKEYQTNFINIGVGKVITMEDLK